MVTRVLDPLAPPRDAGVASGSDSNKTISPPPPVLHSLRIILGHTTHQLMCYAMRASFFTVVWVCSVPIFLSFVWQLLFNTHWLAQEIKRTALAKSVLGEYLQTSQPGASPFWHWYAPGVELVILGGVAVVLFASFWNWCDEAVVAFEGAENFEVPADAEAPEAVHMRTDDAMASDSDNNDDAEGNVAASRIEAPASAEENSDEPTIDDLPARKANVVPPPPRREPAPIAEAPSEPAEQRSPKRAQKPETSSAHQQRHATGGIGMSTAELHHAIDTLRQSGRAVPGDDEAAPEATGFLDHFGLRGSYINAVAVVFAFAVLFVPAVVFVLGAAPFVVGERVARLIVYILDVALSMLPPNMSASGAVAVGVVMQAVSGLPIHALLPLSVPRAAETPPTVFSTAQERSTPTTNGLWHPGVLVFGSPGMYGGVAFMTWCLGALCLGGFLRHLCPLLTPKGAPRKNVAYLSAFVRALVVHAAQIAFLPATFGLLLCITTAEHWSPQPAFQWSGGAEVVRGALQLLPEHHVFMDATNTTSAKSSVLHPLAPLPLVKALHVVHMFLSSSVDSASPQLLEEVVSVVDHKLMSVAVGGSVCKQSELPCSAIEPHLHDLLLRPSHSPRERLWKFRMYALLVIVTRVHLYSDFGTWAPMFLAGFFSSTVLWHCCFHIRRLVHHRWTSWLFRDPVGTPMIQQMIRCRHRMVGFYCLRNITLVLLSHLFVVVPSMWLLRRLFPDSMPMVLSWTSGSAVVDAIGANVVVFGGRFARFMALVGGNVPIEEEVIFRRLAMIAEFIKDAHDAFVEQVGGDLRVTAYLQSGTAPTPSQDFFFPLRLIVCFGLYIVVAALLVAAVLMPGVAMNHWLLHMFPPDDAGAELELQTHDHADSDAPFGERHRAPLTLHAILIGWSLILIGAQIYSAIAPTIRHALLNLRYRLLHIDRLRAMVTARILESATGGAVIIQHHSVTVTRAPNANEAEHQRLVVTGLRVRVATLAPNGDGTGVVQWLVDRETLRCRIATARDLLANAHTTNADPTNALQLLDDIAALLAGNDNSQRPSGPPRMLALHEAIALRQALTSTRLVSLREQCASVFVYICVEGFGVVLTPLLVGSTLLRLCWSGVIRSSTQSISLTGPLPSSVDQAEASGLLSLLDTVIRRSYPMWWVSWCVGALVLVALSVLWRVHFSRCARVLREYHRVGLLQSGASLSKIASIVVAVCGTVMWMTAGVSFFPVSVARWSRTAFALASGTASPWRHSPDFLLHGNPEPSDAEMLLVHFGLLEWILVVTWNAAIALVGDRHLPFLPSRNAWRDLQRRQEQEQLADRDEVPQSGGVVEGAVEAPGTEPELAEMHRNASAGEEMTPAEDVRGPNDEDAPEGEWSDKPQAAAVREHDAQVRARRGLLSRIRVYVEQWAERYRRDDYDEKYLLDIEVRDYPAAH